MPGDPGIIILIALRYSFCDLSVNVAFVKDPQDQNTISYDHLALRGLSSTGKICIYNLNGLQRNEQ